jgi:UDP-N-acetylglucosamine--N-acetylmuramyl-(pentapeptide) pyrophosphoryl-undecaprenol N-acetylglucosamine transferase
MTCQDSLSMRDSPPLFLMAAGGTGGHVFPAEALTRELLGRGARVELVTDSRGGKFSQDLAIPIHNVTACALGRGIFRKIISIIKMGIGTLQATALLKKTKPSAVIGFGGYPSVPLLYAASRAGIPIILHEQNAVLGRANRIMTPMAKLLATSYPHVLGIPATNKAKIVHTGNPVRPNFATVRATPYPAITEEGTIRILVMGGSLGASIFSSVVPKSLSLLPEALRHKIVVAQQCRQEDLENTRAAFAGAGIIAEVSTFFNDVPERMAQAHLVIGRSGGGAVAELTAVGRPSILVPFPYGHAGEQKANAEAIAQAGGAWIIPQESFTPEALAVRLEALLSLPSNLVKAASAARAWGTVTAADNLADQIYDVIELPTPKSLSLQATNPDVSGNEDSLALSTREFYQ